MSNLELSQETIEALNLEYSTHSFTSSMTPQQLIDCSVQAMRTKIDIIDYELNPHIIDKYGIKVIICDEDPFAPQ